MYSCVHAQTLLAELNGYALQETVVRLYFCCRKIKHLDNWGKSRRVKEDTTYSGSEFLKGNTRIQIQLLLISCVTW